MRGYLINPSNDWSKKRLYQKLIVHIFKNKVQEWIRWLKVYLN